MISTIEDMQSGIEIQGKEMASGRTEMKTS